MAGFPWPFPRNTQKARPLLRPGLSRSDEPERDYMPPLLPGGVVVPPVVPLPIEPLVVGSLPSVPLPVVVDDPVASGVVEGVLTVLSGVVVRLRLLLRVVERVVVLGVVLIVSPGWPMV